MQITECNATSQSLQFDCVHILNSGSESVYGFVRGLPTSYSRLLATAPVVPIPAGRSWHSLSRCGMSGGSAAGTRFTFAYLGSSRRKCAARWPTFFGPRCRLTGIGRVSYLIYVSMRHYVLTTSGDIVVCFRAAVCMSC